MFTQKFPTLILGVTIRVAAIVLFFAGLGTSTLFAQTTAYVTNRFDNTVSVIDTATNTVSATNSWLLSIRSKPLLIMVN